MERKGITLAHSFFPEKNNHVFVQKSLLKQHLQNEGARQPEIAVKDTDLKATLEIYHQWSGGLQGCDAD